jgi:hypothetical protein
MTAIIPFDSVRGLLIMHEGQGICCVVFSRYCSASFQLLLYFPQIITASYSLTIKLSDHKKMVNLYRMAQKKWDGPCISKEKLLVELAKEEIIENGIWLSYCCGNAPSVNL